MDPLTTSLLAGLAGGVGGKAVEVIVDLGTKTLQSLFKDQQPAVHEQTTDRMFQLVYEIERQYQQLLDTHRVTLQRLEATVSQPSAAMLIQSALIEGVKTGDKDKHVLLARLVLERLTADEETTLSLASPLASQAITSATPTQLRILGLKSVLDRLDTQSTSPLPYPADSNLTEMEWVASLAEAYNPIKCGPLDFKQLQAIGCTSGRTGMLAPDFIRLVTAGGRYGFDLPHFQATSGGAFMFEMWNNGLVAVELTSVGLLVGIYVTDAIMGTTTDLADWKVTP